MFAYEPTTQERTATELPDNERPEACECWNTAADLACFECYKAGFENQNPNASDT